jgi:hypothetical protein
MYVCIYWLNHTTILSVQKNNEADEWSSRTTRPTPRWINIVLRRIDNVAEKLNISTFWEKRRSAYDALMPVCGWVVSAAMLKGQKIRLCDPPHVKRSHAWRYLHCLPKAVQRPLFQNLQKTTTTKGYWNPHAERDSGNAEPEPRRCEC